MSLASRRVTHSAVGSKETNLDENDNEDTQDSGCAYAGVLDRASGRVLVIESGGSPDRDSGGGGPKGAKRKERVYIYIYGSGYMVGYSVRPG